MDDTKTKVLEGKLITLSNILKLGHEAFQKTDINSLSAHILNNTRLFANYDRACLIDMRDDSPKIIGISGQGAVDPNTEYSINVKTFASHFKKLKEALVIDNEYIAKNKLPSKITDAWKALNSSQTIKASFMIPIKPPDEIGENSSKELFLWILDFFEDFNPGIKGGLILLSKHYSEAFWYNIISGKNSIKNIIGHKKLFTAKKVILALVVLFIILLFVVRVREDSIAEFQLHSAHEQTIYAPIFGKIDKLYVRNGENIKKGQILIDYNTQSLLYQLSAGEVDYQRISAELDVISQKAFNDNEELGKAILLELDKKKAEVHIEEVKWNLDQAVIKSPCNGIVSIDDEENYIGKFVRQGDKLLTIADPNSLIAYVMVDEKDAFVLDNIQKINLFFYSHPEMPVKAKIISVSPMPILGENKQYSYIVKVSFNATKKEKLINGMRGIARVTGDKVSLYYYLTRNLILWWRKI